MRLAQFLVLFLLYVPSALARESGIVHDPVRKLVILSDGQGSLVLRLNYDGRCLLDQVTVRGRGVLAPEAGACSGIQVAGHWFTTRSAIPSPQVVVHQQSVTVKNICFGGGGVQVKESWRFTVKPDRILWQIQRCYLTGGEIEDTCFPGWTFNDMSTWTGGLLGNGGVIWNKYLETTNATFGTHTDSVTFWHRNKRDCFRIAAAIPKAQQIAATFSHQPTGLFSFNFLLSPDALVPKHDLRRFLSRQQDVWKPFKVAPAQTTIELSLQALDYDQEYSRGTIQGLNERSIREVLHTIARYGVIDQGLVGGNGWRTGWACLHEQWFAQFGLALADPGYTKSFTAALDFERDHAITADGRVKPRWHHTPEDARPGTYDSLGFYEVKWGQLLDSQPDYVICVTEQFDLSGDHAWLRGQKSACERALDYLLRRDADGNGLVEAMTDSHLEQKGSDWIDVIWASYENALLNAELYYALVRWADDEALLGDNTHAVAYRQSAAKLKASFNQTTAQGGFWDPNHQWYVYWRDKDHSVHGDNLVTPVNFAAIGYGLCDDPARQHAILDRVESEMQKENLFFWPLCFFTYQPGEGHPLNFPFPKYENGDIFLSWGELGIRCYANLAPALAVKHVRKVLARYELDGLSFQRYLRQTQQGSGDDILAGNCSAVVGLYRDLYGIQPQHDRLYLEPHLTPELSGTRLNYRLRQQQYTLVLAPNDYRASVGRFTLSSSSPFGFNANQKAMQFFPGKNSACGLAVTPSGSGPLEIRIEAWPTNPHGSRRWTELSSSSPRTRYLISNLQPGATYLLTVDGKQTRSYRADKSGCLTFSAKALSGVSRRFELRAV
jgi:hypothetical protein